MSKLPINFIVTSNKSGFGPFCLTNQEIAMVIRYRMYRVLRMLGYGPARAWRRAYSL